MASSQSASLIDHLRQMRDMLQKLPPQPRGIIAHHSVAYGRVHRQWDTSGELWVWVSRGEIEDLPRRPLIGSTPSFENSALFGLPVFKDHPYWTDRS